MPSPSRVRPLLAEEIDACAEMLALAFDADPLFGFLLPDPKRRPHWTRWYCRGALGESVAAGGAYVVDDDPTAGALALVPPEAWPPPLGRQLRAMRAPTALPTPHFARAGLGILWRMSQAHPRDRHLYVHVLGVHPSKQGRGLGGVLLRHAADLARGAGVRSYLETANPNNVGLYRHFGFEVCGEIASHGSPPMWLLETGHVEPYGSLIRASRE